jgi:gliding motility-associated-like protein
VEANAGSDTSVCAGDQVILNGQGGTTISWLPVEGLSDPTSPNPVALIENDIEYILRVEGMFDCYDLDTVLITVYPYTEISAGSDTSLFINDELSITTVGGPFESYSWEPVLGIDDPSSGNVIIQALETTMYVVNAIDENGCPASDTILLSITEKLKIYNVFSPNGDGVNDYWEIDEAEFYPDMSVEVFNRWGERLFGTVGYSDDKRWDGTYRGKNVPIGTYYFVVIPYKGANAINGPVTIVR